MPTSTDRSAEQLARGFFRNRAVVITGASSGIGEDVALGFARHGARVALLARRRSMLDEVAARIDAAGGHAIPIACDVTKRSEVDAAIEEATRALHRIDILVNSAGILIPAEVEKLKLADLERMMSVNVYGALNMIQATLPIMRRQGAASIVNIASLAGRRGLSPLGGYCATKFAMVGLTEALRMELFGTGIRVSLVMPGVIDTPMTTDAVMDNMELGTAPSFFKMPVQWVTWSVLAAVVLGLTEVGVPPGSAVAEKLSALFPSVTDAFLSIGAQMMKAASRFMSNGPRKA
ncbi:MAG TPA: SDR family oxidoreductase [Candidatus Binataceae bacterium]|nr:SDR family oxidoreductase [Candidatus Binataceae bacterium]